MFSWSRYSRQDGSDLPKFARPKSRTVAPKRRRANPRVAIILRRLLQGSWCHHSMRPYHMGEEEEELRESAGGACRGGEVELNQEGDGVVNPHTLHTTPDVHGSELEQDEEILEDQEWSSIVEHILKELRGISKVQEEISDLQEYLESLCGCVEEVSSCVDAMLMEIQTWSRSPEHLTDAVRRNPSHLLHPDIHLSSRSVSDQRSRPVSSSEPLPVLEEVSVKEKETSPDLYCGVTSELSSDDDEEHGSRRRSVHGCGGERCSTGSEVHHGGYTHITSEGGAHTQERQLNTGDSTHSTSPTPGGAEEDKTSSPNRVEGAKRPPGAQSDGRSEDERHQELTGDPPRETKEQKMFGHVSK